MFALFSFSLDAAMPYLWVTVGVTSCICACRAGRRAILCMLPSAAAALLCALCGVQPYRQTVLFWVIFAIALAVRTTVRRRGMKQCVPKTGDTVLVVQGIAPYRVGKIRYRGRLYSAMGSDTECIGAGNFACVIGVEAQCGLITVTAGA